MKNLSYFALFLSGLINVVFFSCTLEKEPEIPIGITNEVSYIFQDTTRLVRVSQDGISAFALLETSGTLNVLQYGWVWSENPKPDFQDNRITLEALSKDSFESLISGLLPGKLYYIRPYIITGSGELFGPEKTFGFVSTTFKKTFGGTRAEYGESVQQTKDGGFILLGSIEQEDQDLDMYLVKTDAAGNRQWEQLIGSPEELQSGESVQQTADGGYILFGSTDIGLFIRNLYLVKTDASGNVQWEQSIGGEGYHYGFCVQQTIDGGFILSGHHFNSDTSTFARMYLVKTNVAGETEWEKTFGKTELPYEESVRQTADGGFILLGTIEGESAVGQLDMYLVKTNAAGELQWERSIPKAGEQYGMSIQQTHDGYILLGGTNDTGSNDMYLVKTDSDGKVEWEKNIESGGIETGLSIQQTADGGYILLGSIGNTGVNEYDMYLVKTTATGIVEWKRALGGQASQFGNCVWQTAEGVFILVGTNTVTGSFDIQLVKTDEYGKVY